jgi:hypothetical protein
METTLNKNQIDAATSYIEIPTTYPGNPLFLELQKTGTHFLGTIDKIVAGMKTGTNPISEEALEFVREARSNVSEALYWAAKGFDRAVKGGNISNVA